MVRRLQFLDQFAHLKVADDHNATSNNCQRLCSKKPSSVYLERLPCGKNAEQFTSALVIVPAEAEGEATGLAGILVCSENVVPLVRERARSTMPSNIGISESALSGCWISTRLCSHRCGRSKFAAFSRAGLFIKT